jgi:hypothetical protein
VTRIRQVVLAARDLDAACAAVEAALPVRTPPFADPGVAEFGLRNAVYELGDTFVEVVSPTSGTAAAARLLDRRGGDTGYMVIVQVDDTARTRARAAELGLRVVWRADLPDIAGTHLHPKDVPGAIVSFDTPAPPASWRWAGPRWIGGAPGDASAGGVVAIAVEVPDVDRARDTWGGLFEAAPESFGVRFTAGDGGLTEVVVRAPEPVDATVCGVRVRSAD